MRLRRRIKEPMFTLRKMSLGRLIGGRVSLLILLSLCARPVHSQTCVTANDMDEPARTALTSAGKKYFDMAARGDSAGLKQNSVVNVAADFSAIETAVKERQANFSAAQANTRAPFLLKAEGTAPLERAEFLCGVFGKNGQTAESAVFVLPNLQPGSYAVVTLDVAAAKQPSTVSFVLQQEGKEWKVGGFDVKDTQVAGHDASWFAERARSFKTNGQNRNAWLYYQEARDLAVPVPFMYTQMTDRLSDESDTVKPPDLPVSGNTVELAAGGKTERLTSIFPLGVGQELDLVVKYQAADVSNTSQTFQENMAVIKALVAKYPEFRDAFDGVVARAVEPSTGRDYGSLLQMKNLK